MQKCFPEGDADAQKPSLQFPPAKETNLDGFKTGWVPGCFRGGTAFIRAYDGGTGGGQSRLLHGRDGSPQPSDLEDMERQVADKDAATDFLTLLDSIVFPECAWGTFHERTK